MDKVIDLLEHTIDKKQIVLIVISNLRRIEENSYNKVSIRPVFIKSKLKFQFTYEYKNIDRLQ